jgi:hypothetical protein
LRLGFLGRAVEGGRGNAGNVVGRVAGGVKQGGTNMKLSIFILALIFASSALAVPLSFTYQGRLTDSGGNAIEGSSVDFKVQILSQDGSCMLYEETHNKNLSGTGGIFSLSVGSGTPGAGDPGLNFVDIFDNAQSFTGAQSCSYDPGDSDKRKIRVSFNSGSGEVTLSPDQDVEAVPFALHALKAQDAASIQGTTLDSALSGLGAGDDGKALVWDGENSKWVAGEVAGVSAESSTQVGFRVNLNGVDSTGIVANYSNFIDWTTEDFDLGGDYYDLAADKYTPQVAGLYWFKCQIAQRNVSDQNRGTVYLTMGSNTFGANINRQSFSGTVTLVTSAEGIVELNGTTDYVRCSYYPDETGDINGGTSWSYFEGALIKSSQVVTTDVQKLNLKDPTELTLSSGAVTVTQSFHNIDTEGDAGVDDLDTINGGTLGDKIILIPADPSRVVWVTNDGNISTRNSRHYPIPPQGAELIFDGTYWKLTNCGEFALVGTHALNATQSMTASEIQAMIDSMPKNLGNASLILQFASDPNPYILNQGLYFYYFYNGTIYVQGNTFEANATTFHTSQEVYLDFSSVGDHGITFSSCGTRNYVANLKIRVADSNKACINVIYTFYTYVRYNYLLAAGKSIASRGLYAGNGSAVIAHSNYFDNFKYAAQSYYSSDLTMDNNLDTGTQPDYGHNVHTATIYLRNSTVQGISGNYIGGGGQIVGP